MTRVFLITANVGSVFDNLGKGLQLWLNEMSSVVRSKNPEFVALHFQETGGKNYVNGSDCIEVFFRQLVLRMEHLHFRVAEAFVDSKSDLEDQFTALSSIYFVHESLRLPVQIWNFQDGKFQEISTSATGVATHNNFHIGASLDQTHRKQKEKFPQHFYPNCKWSRKGFLRTRWRLGKTVVDLVNIHLFHDSCNLVAASAFPSPFAQHREKTLKYTLDRIQSDGLERSPLFIFGDFNFRLNSYGVMDILKKDYGSPGKDAESPLVLGTKRFHCPDHELRFKHSSDWLKPYDFESKQFPGLLEHDLNFHPTYPFEEEIHEPEKFMKTRLPAWCDRVLFTPRAKDVFAKDFPVEYNVIGSKQYMGDHKPVSLMLQLATDGVAQITLNSNQDTTTPPNENVIKGKSLSESPLDFANSSPSPCIISANFATPPYCAAAAAATTPSHNSGLDNVAKVNTFPNLDISSSPAGGNNLEAVAKNRVGSNDDEDDAAAPSRRLQSGSDSPTECKCFDGLLPRGKLRFPKRNGGGGGAGKSRAFGLALKLRRGGSTSLLEPIASAACEPPCSSLPSSGAPSQRPSIAFPSRESSAGAEEAERKSLISPNNLPFFTAPPPPVSQPNNPKWGGISSRELCWKCATTTTSIPAVGNGSPGTLRNNGQLPSQQANKNGTHCTHLLMMNITQNYKPIVVADGNGNAPTSISNQNSNDEYVSHIERNRANMKDVGTNNLGLIALNTNLEKQPIDIMRKDEDGGANGKISVSWTNYCASCAVMNSKNLQNNSRSSHQNGETITTNGTKGFGKGLSLHFRNRSASQGSQGMGQVHKCKCNYRDGMKRTGGCVSCSKCVIL